MNRLWLLLAIGMLATCGAGRKLDLEAYFRHPPIGAPLSDRAALIDAYGEGCVRTEPNSPGAPSIERHAYFDALNGNWIEASVLDAAPDSKDLVGVMVTTVPLCSEKHPLRNSFSATGTYGVKLGDPKVKVIGAIGEPLRVSKERLGDVTAVSVLEYYPEKSNPDFSIRFHVLNERVVAISILFTE